MKNSINIIVILICTNILFTSCYSLSESSVKGNDTIQIVKIQTKDGKIIDFKNNKYGFATLREDKIISINQNGEEEIYLLSNVEKYYKIEKETSSYKYDYFKTFLFTIGILAGLTLLGLIGYGIALSQS